MGGTYTYVTKFLSIKQVKLIFGFQLELKNIFIFKVSLDCGDVFWRSECSLLIFNITVKILFLWRIIEFECINCYFH